MGSNKAHLSCKEIVDLVSDYLEGALTPADVARFEAHIVMCDGCAAYLEQMRATIKLVGELPEDSVPATTWSTLITAFRDWQTRRPESHAT